jgi:hypothetical protein
MQTSLPTPQTVLADDMAAFTRMITEYYPVIYKGLLVAYTGLREPFRLTIEPRYTASVNLDDSESEHLFLGLAGLKAVIRDAQENRRKNAQVDGCSPDKYLITIVQVSIYDAQEAGLDVPRRFICYDLDGDQITGACEQTNINDEVLYGLGLPVVETTVSTMSGSEE